MNISGKDKSKSRLGGLCSLLFIGFLIWALVTASQDLFSRSNPKSIVSQSVNPNPLPITISPETFPIAFQIQASRALNFETYINESIYTLDVYLEITENKVVENGTFLQEVTRKKIVTERCTPEHFGSKMGSTYALIFAQPVYCIASQQPELDKIELVGGFDTSISKVIMADMFLCDSSISSICAPDEVLQEYLSGGYVNILYNGIVVDPNNFDHPNSGFQDYYYTMISPENYHEILVEVGHIGVTTDFGWLTESSNTLNFASKQKVVETTMSTPNSDKILANIAIQLSQSEQYHFRRYKKIQDVLAELGGLTDAVLMILLFVITPYLKLKFSESVMNELFSVRIVPKNKSKSEKGKPKNDKQSSKETRKVSKNDTSFIQQNLDLTNLAILQNDQTIEISPIPKHKGFWDNILQENNGNVRLEDMNYKAVFRDNGSPVKMNNQGEPEFEKQDESASEELATKTKNLDQSNPTVSFAISKINPTETPTEDKRTVCLEKTNKTLDSPNCIELKADNIIGHGIKHNDIESSKANKTEKLQNEDGQIQSTFEKIKPKRIEKEHAKQRAKKHKNLNEMNLGFFEYLYSFISRSKPLKQKVAILNQGTKEIDMRLDINYILKRLMDVDKLLSLLLDKNQLMLFDNLPKPELNIKDLDDKSAEKTFSMTLLRSTTMKKETTQEEKVLEAYQIVKEKEDKTRIDEQLLEIFREKNCFRECIK